MPSIRLITLSCMALLCAMPARALEVTVRVDVTASEATSVSTSEAIKALLMQHLEIARAARLSDPPDSEEIARLRRQSEQTAHELLATEGYFSPRITSSQTGTQVEFSIDPGQRTTIDEVELIFTGALKTESDRRNQLARIERNFTLKRGMPFRQTDWDAAKRAALQPLLAGVFPAAQISSSEARIDPVAHTATLKLSIDSGPSFHYGQLEISGNQRYPVSIVRNLSPLKPGRPLRQQDLLDYQIALEASGYYTQATVRIDPDPAHAAAMPIRVEVVERPEKLLSLGAGVSTDTGARVQIGWLMRNIAERGLRLKLDGSVEMRRQLGAVELAWPRTSSGYDNSLGLQLKREDIEGQETRSNLLAAKRSRTRGQIETTLAVQFQTEAQEIGNVIAADNQALTLNYAWTKRDIPRAFYPRSGHVLSLQLGGASDALLSDTTFVRLYGRHSQYFRLGEKGRLVLRGELGSVIAEHRDGIPTDFLFRAGGDNSVRGYAYQSLGRSLTGGVESVRYLATGSVEYNYFFNRNWGAALFVDAGDAADSPASLSPVFGYGLGARYRSPVGPINLDLAYGDASDEFRLHFSLGVGF